MGCGRRWDCNAHDRQGAAAAHASTAGGPPSEGTTGGGAGSSVGGGGGGGGSGKRGQVGDFVRRSDFERQVSTIREQVERVRANLAKAEQYVDQRGWWGRGGERSLDCILVFFFLSCTGGRAWREGARGGASPLFGCFRYTLSDPMRGTLPAFPAGYFPGSSRAMWWGGGAGGCAPSGRPLRRREGVTRAY